MPSSDFKTVLIKDDRLANLSDSVVYSVNKGGQQVTSARFEASTKSPSSVIFNIQVPSLETVIDRRVMWSATVRLKITGVSGADKQLINYGARDCLGPFPLHSLCQNMSVTINNNTVSCNTKDVLPAMLRMLNNDELAQYNNTTPVAYDQYLDYGDMRNANNNAFGGFDSVADPNIHPRGSYAYDKLTGPAPLFGPMAVGDTEAFLEFTVTEPLLLSPFIFGGHLVSNNGGLHGVQNMSFNFNMGYFNRVFRHTNAGILNQSITNVVVEEIKQSSLQFFFLTCHPSDQLSSRCVVPYYEMPRYINGKVSIKDASGDGSGGVNYSPGTSTINSATISLNQIPDKLIIYVRKMNQNWYDSDSFLPIKNISINFNNNTGMCSSFTREQLWQCSQDAGSNQSFDEFRGYALRPSATITDGTERADAGFGAGRFVRTCGSVLMLDFGKHINLVEDFYAPGSIGSFNLQFKLDVESYTVQPVPGVESTTDFELIVITMNSGAFACERGTSSTMTALLTKQDVLEASQQQAISTSDAKRMVGGGFLDSLKSVFKWVANPQNRKEMGSIIRSGMDVHDIYTGKEGQHDKHKAILGKFGGSRSGGNLMARLK